MDTLATSEELAPHRWKMNYEEYLEFANDSRIVEWVDGEVIIYMPPRPEHQDLVFFIGQLLNSFVHFFKLGKLLIAPFEVKLWPTGPAREPDIIFIAHENLSKLTPSRFEGGPDLLVEVVSPSSASEDRVRKFTQYEQAGVREYWIIDPRSHQQQADFYVLGNDKLYQSAPLANDGRYYSTVISDFWLDVNWLRQDPLPDPQLAFAEIMMSLETLPTDVQTTYKTLYQILTAQSQTSP
jgi:Uma2 family endonuclease